MRHGSLFSGIGGFDLAAEWMGWENVFHCEWNPFGQKVLKYYWPNAESFSDITKTNFRKYEGSIEIISGGFPCQPFSLAGKRQGEEDERNLWPEMLRCIQEIKPRWIVGENVLGITNIAGGLVFDKVQTDLENEGYEVQTYLLPACGINAPHQRFRIFIVAYSEPGSNHRITGRISGTTKETNIDRQESSTTSEQQIQLSSITDYLFGNSSDTDLTSTEYKIQARRDVPTGKDCSRNASDTNGIGLRHKGDRIRKSGFIGKNNSGNYWKTFPTVSPICDGDDGISGRLDSITFSKWRNESIKAGGNAVVPQLVHQIFKAIEAYEVHSCTNKESTGSI